MCNAHAEHGSCVARRRALHGAGQPHDARVQAAKSGASALKQFQPTLRELSQVSNELRTNITNEMGLDELQRDIRDLRDTTRSTFSTSSTPTPTPTPTQPATSSGDEARGKGGASSNGASADGSAAKGGTAGKGALGMDGEEKRALREISEGLASMDERQASAAKAGSSADVALAEDPDIERKRRESAAMAWGGNVPQQLSASDEGAAPTAAKGGEKKRLEDMTMAELEAELAKRKALVDRIKASKA